MKKRLNIQLNLNLLFYSLPTAWQNYTTTLIFLCFPRTPLEIYPCLWHEEFFIKNNKNQIPPGKKKKKKGFFREVVRKNKQEILLSACFSTFLSFFFLWDAHPRPFFLCSNFMVSLSTAAAQHKTFICLQGLFICAMGRDCSLSHIIHYHPHWSHNIKKKKIAQTKSKEKKPRKK